MISLVATVKATLPDLERFVQYHLNIGVGRVYLFFDDPQDPALPQFRGRPGVTATACDPAGWAAVGIAPEDGIEVRQIHNANLALGWARRAGAHWLVHLDVDELLHIPGDDLGAWLGAVAPETDAVTFPTREAIPARSAQRHPFEACWLFKAHTPDAAPRLSLAARAGRLRALRYGYFRGHVGGKSAIRVTAPVGSVDIHVPTGADGAALKLETAKDAFLLHYDGCAFEAWRDKWARRKEVAGCAKLMRDSRRRQFADFLTAEAAGSAAALEREFRAQCMVPLHEQAILWALGLARPVRVRRDLFRPGRRNRYCGAVSGGGGGGLWRQGGEGRRKGRRWTFG